ncbi:MAG: PqqD family protein, partial [Deltaproteobacteria bacterium]
SSSLDDKSIILNASQNSYFSVEGVGEELWRLICDGADYTVLVEWVIENYQISQEIAEQDVSEFLTQLKSEGLIECEE